MLILSKKRRNQEVLTDTFLVQTMNKIQQTGFTRTALDFKDIIKEMRLREKNMKNFDFDLRGFVKNTQNVFHQTLQDRENFFNTKNEMNSNKIFRKIIPEKSNIETLQK